MTKTFDPSLPVRTRNGRPARIVATDRKGEYPIVALIDEGGFEASLQYQADGKVGYGAVRDHPSDLVNVPAQEVRYLNVYPDGVGCAQLSAGDAAKALGDGGATIEITVENGAVISSRFVNNRIPTTIAA